jgi:signal transduction histidine kinase
MAERAETRFPGLASVEAVGDRMVAAMRLVLALAALLVLSVDSPGPARRVGAASVGLAAYVAYSAVLWLVGSLRASRAGASRGRDEWADVLCYTLLVALSGGPNSPLFFFYFFSILAASFRGGLARGLRVTAAAAALFGLVGCAAAAGGDLAPNRFLLREVGLLALGYMTAYWGGREFELKRQLALLGELTSFASARVGLDDAVGAVLEQLRAFYGADLCVQVLEDDGAFRVYRVAVGAAGGRAERAGEELAGALLTLAPDSAVVFRSRDARRLGSRRGYFECGVGGGERREGGAAACDAIAARLDANCFLSVPIRDRDRAVGRIFLTSRDPIFAEADVPFLLQAVEHAAPVLETVRLAADASERERLRVARDLHDSVVQSYVGLQLGLEAVRTRLARGDRSVADDLARLARLASESVADMRQYMQTLRRRFDGPGGLAAAVRRFADAYSRETGIAVGVEAGPDVWVDDGLAAEAFQIVVEALSNVRRHTRARAATVRIRCADGRLTLSVENEPAVARPAPFTPRSIAERANALGGAAAVETGADGATVVSVAVPLCGGRGRVAS